jgi:type II secretory pathway pseudopilin PulG
MTLVELLLAVVLMVALGAVATVALRGDSTRRTLQRGADRLATALRMARADAALIGRRLQLRFDEAEGRFATVYVENDPLGEPGEYTPFTDGLWQPYLSDRRVRVVASRLTGEPRPPERYGLSDDDDQPEAITFYPDGACDTAEIELVDRLDEPPAWKVTVSINGHTGRIEQTLRPVESDGLQLTDPTDEKRVPAP